MQVLKTLRPIRMNGNIVEPGQMVKVTEDQLLADVEYARKLTQEEMRAILNSYVTEAERLFIRKQAPFPKRSTMIQDRLL
jgi:hypothetical protein